MFAAVKLIVAIGLACGTLVASVVGTPYPRLAICFWVAFGLGALGAEWQRARRRHIIRYVRRAYSRTQLHTA